MVAVWAAVRLQEPELRVLFFPEFDASTVGMRSVGAPDSATGPDVQALWCKTDTLSVTGRTVCTFVLWIATFGNIQLHRAICNILLSLKCSF